MSASPDPYSEILAALKAGPAGGARALCEALVARQPRDARAHALLARALNQAGEGVAARAAAERALAIDPTFVPAHLERATAARAADDRPAWLRSLRRAAELAPRLPGIWFDLGVAEQESGEREAAERSFTEAARQAPERYATWIKLGNLAFEREDYATAARAYHAATQRQPEGAEAWLNLGESLIKLNDFARAVTAFERTCALEPNSIRAHDGLARALKDGLADPERWLAARKRAADLSGSPVAQTQLAMDYWKLSRLDLVREAHERAIAIDERYLPGYWGKFQYPLSDVFEDDAAMARFRAEWTEGLAEFERRMPDDLDPITAASCATLATNFHLHYLGEPFVEEQRHYARVVQRLMRAIDPIAAGAPRGTLSFPRTRARDGRLRIGFCSGFVRRHTVMKLFESVIVGLDPREFEVSLFHTANQKTPETERIAAQVEHFAMGENDLPWWIDTIRARELDLLLYIDIGMHPIVQGIAATRLAPVQAVLWGHPVTTGLDTIDYFLTSDLMEPPGGERNYTETLVRLPNLGTCYAVPRDAPVVPPELATPDPTRVEYLFGQSAFKILPIHDHVLARIARELPSARFHLMPHPSTHTRRQVRDRMTRHFAREGLDFDAHAGLFRFVKEPEYLGVASRVAVNLDSLGWSGGNTTLEVLWFDTPTVTLPGALMRGRHTYAMLKRLELDELIARDLNDYVRIAVELGRSPDWRAELSAKIAERKHRLYDDREVIAAVTRFLREHAASAATS